VLGPVTELSTRHSSVHSLNKDDLLVPQTALKFGNQVFSLVAPTAWNIQQTSTVSSTPAFKKLLKLLVFYIS